MNIEEISTKIDDLTPVIIYKNLVREYKGINKYIFKNVNNINKNDIVDQIKLTCHNQKISIAIFI